MNNHGYYLLIHMSSLSKEELENWSFLRGVYKFEVFLSTSCTRACGSQIKFRNGSEEVKVPKMLLQQQQQQQLLSLKFESVIFVYYY